MGAFNHLRVEVLHFGCVWLARLYLNISDPTDHVRSCNSIRPVIVNQDIVQPLADKAVITQIRGLQFNQIRQKSPIKLCESCNGNS